MKKGQLGEFIHDILKELCHQNQQHKVKQQKVLHHYKKTCIY